MDDDVVENIRKHFNREHFIRALEKWGNPINRGRDGEMADEEYLDEFDERELDDWARKVRLWQGKKMQQQNQKEQAELFTQAHKELQEELGLSDVELREITNEVDREFSKKLFKQNYKNHIRGMIRESKHPKAKEKLRGKDGRFMASSYQSVSGDESKVREDVKRRDVDAVLKRLFPSGDPFFDRALRTKK
jgi:hypothetical protein